MLRRLPLGEQQSLRVTCPLVTDTLKAVCRDIIRQPRLTREEFSTALKNAAVASYTHYTTHTALGQQFEDNIYIDDGLHGGSVQSAFAIEIAGVASALLEFFDILAHENKGKRRR